mgnify:CR=1 FL=1
MQDGSSYSSIVVGETPIGGFSPMPEETGAWTIFVTVPDVDAAVTRAEASGGTVLAPAMDMPGVGRMATLADPQGARFAVIAYEADLVAPFPLLVQLAVVFPRHVRTPRNRFGSRSYTD